MIYHPTMISGIEALLEPGQTLIHVSDWTYDESYWVDDYGWKSRTRSMTLALASESLYNVWFKKVGLFGRGGFEVADWAGRWCAAVTEYEFAKHKSNKGQLLGYRFQLVTGDSAPNLDVYATVDVAEPFMENFEAVMARVHAMAVTAPADIATQLRELKALLDEGILSPDEYERSKALFLGQPADATQATERALRGLHELHKAGVLTAAEFAAKKFAVISGT